MKYLITLLITLFATSGIFAQELVLEIYNKKKENKTYIIDYERTVFLKAYNKRRKSYEFVPCKLERIEGEDLFFKPKNKRYSEIKKNMKKVFELKLRTGASITGTAAISLLTGQYHGEALQYCRINSPKWGIRVIEKTE